MSLSEIEHSLHNIKMRKHQVRKDQNSNKFCLCAAHDWRQHCLWHLFPEKKRHRTALSSLCQTIRTHGTKHSEAWAVRTDPEGILHVLSWKAEVSLVKKTPTNNKPKLKQPKLLCINIGGYWQHKLYTAVWKSEVYKNIFITVLLSCSTLEVKISIYWNFPIQVISLGSIFKGRYLNSRNKEHMHRWVVENTCTTSACRAFAIGCKTVWEQRPQGQVRSAIFKPNAEFDQIIT